MKRCGVYYILNAATGRHYVGSSIDIDRRWSDHISRLRHNAAAACVKLRRAWRKHGEQSFYFGILEYAQKADLHAREEYWIGRLRASTHGMNVLARPGWLDPPSAAISTALTGRKHSAETRAKMSASHKGRVKSPDEVKKIADALRGRPLSPEHRAKLHHARLNLTPEQRARMVAANRRINETKKGLTRPQIVKDRVSASLRAYWSSERSAGRRS